MDTSFDLRRQLKHRRYKCIDSRSEALILLNNGHQSVKIFRNFSPTAMGFDVPLLEPMQVFESLSRCLGIADKQEILRATSNSLWYDI